jgi:peptidoglycan/xylan/chitin deacetylase (PgdA/CDA1 family)
MISLFYDTKDPYRIYGINHFIKKYGIQITVRKDAKIQIIYGKSTGGVGNFTIQILENELEDDLSGFLTVGDERVPLFEKPVRLTNGKPLILFTDGESEYPCVVSEFNRIRISFDVFNEVGHILSGYLGHIWELEENRHNRIANIPVVDYYEKLLFDCLPLASKELKIPFKYMPLWPNDKKFAVCLTHDVDRVQKTYQYLSHFIKYLKKGDFHCAVNQIISLSKKVRGNEPYWNFERILEMERSMDVTSTFFFLNEKRKLCLFSPKEWKLYWGVYDITAPKIVETIKRLDAEGWEIGIHGSYNSYKDVELLEREKKALENLLGKSVSGISQHYRNLAIPETWEYHEKLGLAYDSSIGFVTDIGFMYGTCHPFHPYNPAEGRTLSLWELPITIMDNACAYKDLEDILEVINIVERYGGLLLLRWHQSVFNEREFPQRSEIYKRIIEVCKERNAWITNAYEIANYLTSREEQLSQVIDSASHTW